MARSRTGARPLVITDRRRVRALESGVRQDIVDAVIAGGPATIAEIGGWLGRRPDTLYYHVATLVRVGLLLEVGKRRAGKRFSAVYDVPGRPMYIRVSGGVTGEDVVRVVRSTLRLAARDMRRAMESGAARMEDPGRNLWGGRVRGWIRGPDIARVGELLAELNDLVRRRVAPSEDAIPYSLTCVASPIAPRQAKRRNKKGGVGGKASGSTSRRGTRR